MITKLVLASVLVCSITGYDNSSGMPPYGITSSGAETEWGIVACAKQWPFGTIFQIEELGVFECQDRGGAIIEENQVDIWYPSYQRAKEAGVRRRWCSVYVSVEYLLRPSERARMGRWNSLRGEK